MRLHQQRIQRQAKDGFTLVEMIGVLAIISILASLLIPRVFQAIGDSKISNASTTCNSIKAAVNEYYGTYGLIAGAKGASLNVAAGTPYEDWDLNVLVAEGFAEKPFSVRIGNGNIGSTNTGSRLRVINIVGNDNTTAITAGSGSYNLNGDATINDITGALLVEAVIEGVDIQDARALNDRLDGTTLGGADLATADEKGRVKYAAPANGQTAVHIYLAHR